MAGAVCRVCGRGPAIEVQLRRQIGMIVMSRMFTFRGALCREHGEQLGKQYLNKTLVEGWWGIIAFVLNLAWVTMDLSTLSKIRKLDPPLARSTGLAMDSVAAPAAATPIPPSVPPAPPGPA